MALISLGLSPQFGEEPGTTNDLVVMPINNATGYRQVGTFYVEHDDQISIYRFLQRRHYKQDHHRLEPGREAHI